jgi:LCP family protein required for cell wall assembly
VLVGVVVVLLVVAIGADYVILNGSVKHVHLTYPGGGTGTTYVIVGSDSRSELPFGGTPQQFGTTSSVPGQRADVVLVVHTVGKHTWLLSVPRDTLVSPSVGTIERLTLTLDTSPQTLVDGLCRSLGITTDHLIIVNFATFSGIIDQLGGITVHLPYPIRDPAASLDIPTSGQVHLDGLQALALVRSRNPQWLIHGTWTTVPDGATQRTDWAGRVFSAVLHSLKQVGDNPIELQGLARAAASSLTADQRTHLLTLFALSRVSGPVVPLPVTPVANSLAVTPNAAAMALLARADYRDRCVVN